MATLQHRGGLAAAMALTLFACIFVQARNGATQGTQASADAMALRGAQLPANAMWLERLDLRQMSQDWQTPRRGRSVEGNPITLKGVVYPHGVGTHAKSELSINIKGAATRFLSMVGVDDEKAQSGASVTFEVWVDNKKAGDSGVMRGGQEPKLIDVNLTGAKRMVLRVGDADDGIDSDHADWAGAMLFLVPGASVRPEAAGIPVEPPRLTIPPTPDKPAIHGPRVTGATPGRPFLFLIPATGKGPLTFAAKNLPAGVTLDKSTGILSGALRSPGQTVVALTVTGPAGRATRSLTIVGGEHKLALTPPLGWNSWNVWAGAVDAAKVRAAADAMLKSGLAAHGFQYVNIDDTWEGQRDASGELQTNAKFPDMKALSDYVHSKGLRLGIYSSPGPRTCGGYVASYQHEEQDARTWAKWGIDYLKHDWCSYSGVATGEGLERLQKPYRWMREALDKTDRDIVYSLCQYGMGNVWEWGTQVGGNCWRTTGDINDSWGSLHGIYSSQDGHEKFVGPGHWNDPDMLVVGKVGWGPSLHPSHLTPNEQILHISMWCLLSSPLLIGCDMSDMDPFTVALLSNDEALEINQDPLGKPAGRRTPKGMPLEVWSRPLFDGTVAVGLLNSGTEAQTVTADWAQIGLKGSQPVRDLWLHKNAGTFADKYGVSVPAHGCVLLKVGKPQMQHPAVAASGAGPP
jgi:alpha-galactosidase